jgi:hypothetical protein
MVTSQGTGWSVEIRPEGGLFTSAEYPKTTLSPDRHTALEQARKIVDDLLASGFDKGASSP